MILADTLGAAFKAQGHRLHTYPAHPSLVRAFDKSRVGAAQEAGQVLAGCVDHVGDAAYGDGLASMRRVRVLRSARR
jgi:hypothetical protein